MEMKEIEYKMIMSIIFPIAGGVKPYGNEQLIAPMFGVILENNSV